jgi:hypothetical protein
MTYKKSEGFIRIQTRSNAEGASQYGIFCPPGHGNTNPSKRTEKDRWLGKVLDIDNGIFFNKKEGIFQLTIPDGITDLDGDVYDYYMQLNRLTSTKDIIISDNRLIYDFGDTFIVNSFIKDVKVTDILDTLPFKRA